MSGGRRVFILKNRIYYQSGKIKPVTAIRKWNKKETRKREGGSGVGERREGAERREKTREKDERGKTLPGIVLIIILCCSG